MPDPHPSTVQVVVLSALTIYFVVVAIGSVVDLLVATAEGDR